MIFDSIKKEAKMEKKSKKERLSSSHLKILKKDFEKIQKAENYLEIERTKLIKEKEKIRTKIKKEKEILQLRKRIERIQNRKK